MPLRLKSIFSTRQMWLPVQSTKGWPKWLCCARRVRERCNNKGEKDADSARGSARDVLLLMVVRRRLHDVLETLDLCSRLGARGCLRRVFSPHARTGAFFASLGARRLPGRWLSIVDVPRATIKMTELANKIIFCWFCSVRRDVRSVRYTWMWRGAKLCTRPIGEA